MSERTAPSAEEAPGPLERVWAHTLPASVEGLIAEYESVVGDRDRFLWKWAHHLFPTFTLSTVAPEHRATVRDDKLAGLVFVSLLDDVAEKHGDRATFEEAAKVPFEHRRPVADRPGVDPETLAFAREVWDRFAPAVREGPRASEFEEVVNFDVEQVLNAIRYSWVANEDVAVLNGPELRTYDAHNMMLYVFADVDLVHSPAFEWSDLATIRCVVGHAQRMVRIGNWITTWERELHEGDVSSGVVVRALETGLVTVDDLRALRAADADVAAVVETIREHDVEEAFLETWRQERDAARTYEGAVDSVDVGAYLDGVETVMDYHLASRGLK